MPPPKTQMPSPKTQVPALIAGGTEPESKRSKEPARAVAEVAARIAVPATAGLTSDKVLV